MKRAIPYSKILVGLVAVLFAITLSASYYHIFLNATYPVIKQVDCDPQTEKCFVSDCETNDSTCDSTPYKKIFVESKYAGNDYDALTCTEGAHCSVVTCSEATVEDGERCAS